MGEAKRPTSPFDMFVGLHENFELRGFWRPASDNSVEPVPGFLTWDPSRGGYLKLFGLIPEDQLSDGLVGLRPSTFPVTEHFSTRDSVILLGCKLLNRSSAEAEMDVAARIIATACKIEAERDHIVKSMYTEYSHLGEWLAGSLFVSDEAIESNQLSLETGEGFHIHGSLGEHVGYMNINYVVNTSYTRSTKTLSSKASAKIEYNELVSFESAWAKQRAFRRILSLLAFNNVVPLSCKVSTSYSAFGNFYTGHQYSVPNSDMNLHWNVVPYDAIKDIFFGLLSKWFSIYDDIELAVGHYTDIAENGSVPVQFYFLKAVLAYETLLKVLHDTSRETGIDMQANGKGGVKLANNVRKDLARFPKVVDAYTAMLNLEPAALIHQIRGDIVHGSTNRHETKDIAALEHLGRLMFGLFRYRILNYLGVPAKLNNVCPVNPNPRYLA